MFLYCSKLFHFLVFYFTQDIYNIQNLIFLIFGKNICNVIGKNGHDVWTMNFWQTLLVPRPDPLNTYHPCPVHAGSSLPQAPVALPEAVSGSPLRGKGLMCRGVGTVS